MQGPTFIFCFVDRLTANPNFWKINGAGKAVLSATPYFLEYSPDGWLDLAIQNVRNRRYFGIDRTVTIPFDYVEDGATILKTIAIQKGPEATVYLKVCRRTLDYTPGVNYGFWYKQIYTGEVDMTTINHKGSKVTVTTLEDGLPKFLKANENTTIELAMNVPDAIYWKADGINLKETANYSSLSGTNISLNAYGEYWWCGGPLLNIEGKSTGVVFQTENVEEIPGTATWPEVLQSTNFIAVAFDNPAPLIIKAKGKIEFTCTGMTSSPAYAVRFRFLRSNQLIGNQNDYAIFSTPAMVVGTTYTHDFDIDIPLQAGERLYLEGIFYGGPGSDVSIEFTENSKYTFSYTNTYKTTYLRALRPQYIMQKLLEAATEGSYQPEAVDGVTNYFGTDHHFNKPLTSGNAIRGLDDATMKISWSDFFQWWDSFDSVGIMPKDYNKIKFDRKKNLIDTSSSISIGSVSNLSWTFDRENFFNEYQAGYPEIRNEAGILNGNDEFNCRFLFSLGTTKAPRLWDKTSKVKASCYEIENIRIQVADKLTTDYKNDNDNYCIHIENTLQPAAGDIPAHYKLDRTLNAYATGLNEPATVFNIELSPKRCIERNGDEIRNRTYKMEGRKMAYKTADKNNAMVTTIPVPGNPPNRTVEKDDVLIGDLDQPYLLPIFFNFECVAPFELLELLDTNPLQVFDFDFEGINYKGILINVRIAPGNNKAQEYQLMSLATNDLTNLIDYYG